MKLRTDYGALPDSATVGKFASVKGRGYRRPSRFVRARRAMRRAWAAAWRWIVRGY